jgi:hypothetical protein
MASILKVDTIQDQSGNNIINENADTITIGASGDTITIPSGATLSSTDPLVFPAGTVSLPAITTTGDTNTGIFFPAADTIAFTEGGAEAMRIDSSGRVGIANTTPNYNLEIGESDGVANRGLSFNLNNNVGQIRTRSNLSDTQTHYEIINSNGVVGTIRTSGSATSFNTSSDHRLKENVNYNFDATTRLKQLKPARFNFIADANTTVDGFIAHEVQEIIPEAISGKKDAVDEKGNILPQGIDQSKLTPILTKALQEAIAKIEQLEARITTLENK